MKHLKKFVKKYFSSFAFFYSYLRNKVFIAFGLSLLVSVLDGLGLSMFFPLLQVVGGENINVDSSQMGKLGFLIDWIENLGIGLNITSVLMVMIFFFVLKGIVYYLNSIYRVIITQSFIKKIRLDLLNNLNQMSFKKFILSDAGRIQNTMSGEVGRISGAFSSYFQTIQNSIMLTVYIAFAFVLDPKFALLVSFGGLMTHFLYHIIYKYTVEASKKFTKHGNTFQGQIIQHVGHFKYLKATGRVNQYGDRMEKTIEDIEVSRRQMGFLASVSEAAREPLLVIIISLVIFIQFRYLGGNMGTMLISLLFFYRALTYLVALQQTWNNFLQVSGSMENLRDFQQMLLSNKERNGKIELPKFKDSIELKDVNFYYDNTLILKNINLEIPARQSIAFVGESGSGKTTLVNLIAALLHEDEGEIRVDDVPVKTIKKESYQDRIGYVSQDAVIFNDSIYNNVTFWAEKTTENINRFNQSIQQASLTEFIEELPNRAETLLGNNGINLSGGQKQRISIARELFKEIDILILDEATSALDSETEREIQQSIEELQGQYTLIIVAHRLSTIRNVDRVILMDKGVIVDSGSFEELVQKQEKFRKMVELQEL
ncbi:MAG: ABC transporter ATP-binding protein [Weeksellaceae bacterium]